MEIIIKHLRKRLACTVFMIVYHFFLLSVVTMVPVAYLCVGAMVSVINGEFIAACVFIFGLTCCFASVILYHFGLMKGVASIAGLNEKVVV